MFIQLQPQYLTIWELELELFAIEHRIILIRFNFAMIDFSYLRTRIQKFIYNSVEHTYIILFVVKI